MRGGNQHWDIGVKKRKAGAFVLQGTDSREETVFRWSGKIKLYILHVFWWFSDFWICFFLLENFIINFTVQCTVASIMMSPTNAENPLWKTSNNFLFCRFLHVCLLLDAGKNPPNWTCHSRLLNVFLFKITKTIFRKSTMNMYMYKTYKTAKNFDNRKEILKKYCFRETVPFNAE